MKEAQINMSKMPPFIFELSDKRNSLIRQIEHELLGQVQANGRILLNLLEIMWVSRKGSSGTFQEVRATSIWFRLPFDFHIHTKEAVHPWELVEWRPAL